MRRDMDKVLCERPRQGASFERRSRYRGPLEDAPAFESTSRNRGGCKSLNEHLGPLRRWLRAQAGRPWSAVYSELRANISPKNAVQMHIWQHAQQYVAEHVEIVDGKPRLRQYAHLAWPELSPRWTPVYVCPKTGILRLTPAKARKRKKQR